MLDLIKIIKMAAELCNRVLCLRDSKNAAFLLYVHQLSALQASMLGLQRHAKRAQKRQADFDWLNPHSLGTISTFDSIANLA